MTMGSRSFMEKMVLAAFFGLFLGQTMAQKSSASKKQPAEPPIFLVNASFEDIPKSGEPPTGWSDCGQQTESPPDVQPGHFSVTKPAQHGNSYLGLVVRDNETWEAVSQRLSRPIEAGKCYNWSLQLCKSEIYMSLSRKTNEQVNYATPAKIRIWGGSGYCNKKELLAESAAIVNSRWLNYDFRLQPKQTHTYIVIEAYYKTPILFFYNGNILIDNAGPITPIPCHAAPPKADPEPPIVKKDDKKPDSTGKKPSGGTTKPPVPKPAPPPIFAGKEVKVGEVVRAENIFFDANKSDLKGSSEAGLQQILEFLQANPNVTVEIGGHTNGVPADDFCDKLSTERAKSVADWLTARGISTAKVQHKGYGKRVAIASNATAEGRKKKSARRGQNRRRELKKGIEDRAA